MNQSNDHYEDMKNYWEYAAQDPKVDQRYIADVSTKKCLKELGKLKGDVLEIGCGVGRLIQDGWCGIDISPRMLEIAKKRQPKGNYKLTLDGNIPYKDARFGTVYSMLVFQHLKPNEVFNYIKEAHRVLKDGGLLKFQFIVGDEREPFSNHYTKEEITNWCLAAGFKTVDYKQSDIHFQWTWCEARK